jgi:site-specific DNA-methyltransferase (adenine-specific)
MYKIIQGDCLEVMRTMPDKSVDLILTDPPYGIKEARKDNTSRTKLAIAKAYPNGSWDDSPPTQEAFNEMFRVSKNQIIFGANHFSDRLPRSSCWIVWDKDNGKNDFADCELVWTSFTTAVRKIVWRWNGMLQEPGHPKEYRIHRNQKPVGLIIEILKMYATEGQSILDCYSGSGSIALACEKMGLNCTAIEIDPKYCAMAEKRIRNECGLLLGRE